MYLMKTPCVFGAPAFVSAPTVVGFTPRSSLPTMQRRRCNHVLRLAGATEATEDGDGSEDYANPNLFRVTPVPGYKEMLAWAADTDQRIAAGELPPLGSGQLKAGEKAQLLSDQERAQMTTVSELLSKRRGQGSPLSDHETDALRAAMEGLTAAVNEDGGFATDSSSSTGGVSGAGNASGDATREGADFVHNPIYGSREVRDKVYLYAWSLLKRRQEEFEQREQQQQQQQQRR